MKTDPVREAFEANADKRGYILEKSGEFYTHQDTHERWLGWQAALARDEASVLTDEQIVRSGYMHTTEDDEPLFQFDRKELIAMVRELIAASSPTTSK